MKTWHKVTLGVLGALAAAFGVLLFWPYKGLYVLNVLPKFKTVVALTPFGLKHIRYDRAGILRANNRWYLKVSTIETTDASGVAQFATGVILLVDKDNNQAFDLTIRQDGNAIADQYAYSPSPTEIQATV